MKPEGSHTPGAPVGGRDVGPDGPTSSDPRPAMRYYVTVAGRTLTVDLIGDSAIIEGQRVDVRLEDVGGNHLRHLNVDTASHVVVARPDGRKGTWAITIGGRTLVAEAVDERTRTIREMSGGAAADAERVVVAPMPGLIVRLNVVVGDAVSAGQGLVVVEAMKMENELKAPADGIVSRIAVEAGSAVEKGAVLVVLE